MDALIYADMTIGAGGQRVSLDERISEMLRRYSSQDPVSQVISRRATPALRVAVERAASGLAEETIQPI